MQACWDAAGEVIKAWATEGHSVALPGLGTMRFGLRAKSVATVDEVKSKLIKSRKIIFTPSTELKDELSNTSVQITCYDKDGNELKRVTSTDEGIVEDPEGDETGEGDGKTDGSNENQNQNENGSNQNQNPEPETVNPEPGNGGGGGTEDGTDES
jgi:nucleoid DNA-binding protein